MPIRFYKRIKLGKSSGIYISPGSARLTKSERQGCASLAYYLLIAWWWIPLKWIMKVVWLFAVFLIDLFSNLFSKLSNLITNRLNTSRNVGKLLTVLLIMFLCGFCFLTSYIYSQTPQGKASALAREQTLTANPTSTKRPTLTNRPTLTSRPTNTPRPTGTTTATRPPTQTRTPLPPTATLDPNRPCDCWINYDCSAFTYQSEAQTCFNYCGGSASYNWSSLDGNDHDGRVCESLP